MQSAPAASSPTHPRKGGADWLGLKDDDLLPPSPTREAQRGGSALSTPSMPPSKSQHSAPSRHSAPAGLPSSSLGPKPPTEGAGFPAKASQASQLGASEEREEEDWLSHALSRKKSQALAREEHTEASRGQKNLVGAVGSPPSSRYKLGFYLREGRVGRVVGGQPCPSWCLSQECRPAPPLSCAFPPLRTLQRELPNLAPVQT